MDETISKTKSWSYVNGKLISIEEKNVIPSKEWKADNSCYNENLGIGSINPMYIEVNENQDIQDEYKKIKNFLSKFKEYYASKNEIDINAIKIKFLNYGKTELVYTLTDGKNRVTLLVKQPAVIFGKVLEEANILMELNNRDVNVVAPIDYFSIGDQELYVTPYIYQARCVASYNKWGIYVPEPQYRFVPFTEEQQHVVTQCMIAKLISYFNFQENNGIKSCKLGGGDFMLPKGWELETPTIKNTINNLYFIAAREKIDCSFEDYLNIIRREFSRITINEKQDDLLINLRGRVAIEPEDIEAGIKLGLELIERSNFLTLKKRIL